MSGDLRDPSTDGVEMGKRLIHLPRGNNLSFAEQITRIWHRMTWRGPFQSLRSSKAPLQLLAVPDDQVLGDAIRGHALMEKRLRWMKESASLNEIADPSYAIHPALAAHLHSFAWLRDLSSVAARKDAAPIAEDLARIWLERFGGKPDAAAWKADLSGRRILFVTAHAPLVLSDAQLRPEILKMLDWTARRIPGNVSQADEGLPRIASWAGVIAAGLLFPGDRARLAGGEAGLLKAMRASVTDDGGLVSRSPVEQFNLLSILILLKSAYEASPSHDAPEFLTTAIARAAPALQSVVHGDGGLSGFQGSPPIESHRIQTAISASGGTGRPSQVTRDWGYQQVVAGQVRLIIDAGPPPANRHAKCGCASALAIEISDGTERLITGCGAASALSGELEERLSIGLRSTAAHSVISIAEANSNALLKNGSLGPGVNELSFTREDRGDFTRLSGAHDGYAERFGFETRRVLSVDKLGRAIRGEEMLIPIAQGKGGKAQPVHLRFHAGPGVAVTKAGKPNSAEFQLPSGGIWLFTFSEGVLDIEPSLWIDASGTPRQTAQACVSIEAPPGGLALSWSFERVPPKS